MAQKPRGFGAFLPTDDIGQALKIGQRARRALEGSFGSHSSPRSRILGR